MESGKEKGVARSLFLFRSSSLTESLEQATRAAIFHPGCDGNPGWQCESSCPQVLAGFVFTEADASIGIKDVCLLPTGSKS